MATSMKVSGRMDLPTDKDTSWITMVPITKAIGWMISSMVRAMNSTSLGPNSRGTLSKARKMATVCSGGPTDQPTSVSLKITVSADEADILQLESASMMANGRTTRCTARENSLGLIRESIQVNSKTTNAMVKVSLLGPMDVFIKGVGQKTSNMVLDTSLAIRTLCLSKESGMMESVLDGCTLMKS